MEILVVGCGSLGGAFIQKLVEEFPDSSFYLVDHDKVETGNIERHPHFTFADVGLFKTDVISSYYRDRIKFTSLPHRIEQVRLDFFTRFQIIILTVDSLTTRRWVNWALYETPFEMEVPLFIEAGCEGKMAHSRLFRPLKRKKGPCIECTKSLYTSPAEIPPLCSLPSKLSTIEQCIQWARIILVNFDLPQICELAKNRAKEMGLDPNLLDLTKCKQVLGGIGPTEPSTNQEIARETLIEVKDRKDWMSQTVFISIQNGHEPQRIVLEPTIEYCPVCW
jgi:molybdopterin/thiamine biosynthesis adenylyltransferase